MSQQHSDPPLSPAPFDHQLLLKQLDDEQQRRTKRKLRISKRFYEFYVAPVTTFWAFSLTYSAFLILLAYVCLVRTPELMQPAEWVLLVYVLNIGLEQVRKVRPPSSSQAQSECSGFDGRAKVIRSQGVGALVKSLEFSYRVCGIRARCRRGGASVRQTIVLPSHNHTSVRTNLFFMSTSRQILRKVRSCEELVRTPITTNAVLWYLKLLNLFSIHNRLGQY
jgi:hypothetical protein